MVEGKTDDTSVSATVADEKSSFMQSWGALVALCLTMFIVVLDSSMMNVAVPQIADDLETDITSVQAVISIYSLVMAALMLTGARIGSIRGSVKVYRIALYVYGAGTLLATFSWNIWVLGLGWSVIEGIAAAALLPLSMSLVVVNYSGAKRALAFGILGGFQATAAAIGPIFGGFLTTALSWRAGFAFEVVIVFVVLAILHHVSSSEPRPDQTVDWFGTVLSVVGFGSIVLGALLAGRHGWFNARRTLDLADVQFAPLGLSVTFWMVLFGVAVLVGFAQWQRHREHRDKTPLVRTRIFGNGTFVTGFSTDALQSVTLAGILFVLPLFMQQTLGFDPLGAGVALLPLSITVLAVSMVTPGWGRFIHAKYLVQAGAAIMAASIFWLASIISVTMSGWDFALPLVAFGIGTGLLLAQVPNLTLSSLEPDESEEGSGVQNAAKETGTSLGTAIIGSVLLVSTFSSLVGGIVRDVGADISDADQRQLVVEFEDQLAEATEAEQTEVFEVLDEVTPTSLETIADDAAVDGMQNALSVVAVFVILAFLAATWLPRGKNEDADNLASDDRERIPRLAPTPERGT